jgi:DNA-binding transcriptional LysR family regulator
MKFQRISVFARVSETSNLSAVAREMKLSTAAISKQIAMLEKELELKLFDRTTRNVSLTEAGQIYYSQCKQILSELKELDTQMSQYKAEPSGTLRVVSARYFGEKYIIPRLKKFLERYPKLQMSLELSERMPSFENEKLDIIYGMSMSGPVESIRKKICSTRYVICGAPRYFKKHGFPQKLEDLKSHRYIAHSMRSPDSVLELKGNKRLNIDPTLRLNDTRAMLDCAIQGMGIVYMHEYVVDAALKEGKLVELFPEHLESKIPIFLYYRESKHLAPKVRCFIEYFQV